MFAKIKEYKDFPQNVKISLIMLFITWTTFFISVSSFLHNYGIRLNIQQIISGAIVCLSILTINNRARLLCIACNLMLIIQFMRVIPNAIAIPNPTVWLLFGINVALFSLATILLMLKPVSDFFKANTKPLYGNAPPEQNGNQE